LARRIKKQIIIIPGMWFHSMTRTEQQEYKNKNKPSGCENCEEYLIHSNDNLRTWMCGNCKFNEFSPKKNPHI